MSDGSRWARIERTIDPDPRWLEPTAERYERFRTLTADALL
ncbi:MAG: hypothetical protein QOF97_2738, partial [Acidimicrobiaceae bacterium]